MAGRHNKAFLSLIPDYENPMWEEMRRISDVKRTCSRSTSDRMFRGAKNKKKVTGYIERGFSFKYHPSRSSYDIVLEMLRWSYTENFVIPVCFMDRRGIGPGGTGVFGPMLVTKMDEDEADESPVSYDVELVEAEAEFGGQLIEIDVYEINDPASAPLAGAPPFEDMAGDELDIDVYA